jgi:hypothetical protein
MALSAIDGNSLSQLISTLQGLTQVPGAAPGGAMSPTDLFDPGMMGNGLAGPTGALSAPPGLLPSVDPAASLSAYSDFGSAGLASLSPTETSMYQQLAAQDPVAAQEFLLQLKMQDISQLAQEVSNVSKTRHDAIMSVVANLKG